MCRGDYQRFSFGEGLCDFLGFYGNNPHFVLAHVHNNLVSLSDLKLSQKSGSFIFFSSLNHLISGGGCGIINASVYYTLFQCPRTYANRRFAPCVSDNFRITFRLCENRVAWDRLPLICANRWNRGGLFIFSHCHHRPPSSIPPASPRASPACSGKGAHTPALWFQPFRVLNARQFQAAVFPAHTKAITIRTRFTIVHNCQKSISIDIYIYIYILRIDF